MQTADGREEEIIEAIAKVLWDAHRLEKASNWNEAGWSKPFNWAKIRYREIARELVIAIRKLEQLS